mmetsp:Transcript_68040/g.208576  ORF Transcript_68040/g.208576 Transcript_68040/m.208576 type:complete len:213 (-) Transcript_68040:847-1485(-)
MGPAPPHKLVLLQEPPWQLHGQGHAPGRAQLVLGRYQEARLPRPPGLPVFVAGAQHHGRAGGRPAPAWHVLPHVERAGLRHQGRGSVEGLDRRGARDSRGVVRKERKRLCAQLADEQGAMGLHGRPPQGAAHQGRARRGRGYEDARRAAGGKARGLDTGRLQPVPGEGGRLEGRAERHPRPRGLRLGALPRAAPGRPGQKAVGRDLRGRRLA